MDYQQIVIKCDKAIREGDVLSVQKELNSLTVSQIPRNFCSDFADLSRRSGLPTWGLRLLQPLVRPSVPIHPPTTSKELCSYAGLLIKVGAVPEARDILKSLADEPIPNALPLLSQTYVSEWNYAATIPILNKALKLPFLTDYERCVVRVNLAGSLLVLSRFDESKKLIAKIMADCLEMKWQLLYGNALEISAQIAVFEKNWDEADRLLTEAENLHGQQNHYSILIEKWRTISTLLKTSTSKKDLAGPHGADAIAQLQSLKSKSIATKTWEMLRDLDFHEAIFNQDRELFLKIYFGTPHPHYRLRIEKIFKKHQWSIPLMYVQNFHADKSGLIFDLETGQEIPPNEGKELKTGQLLHRCLYILLEDFYKPITAGEFFAKLFPGEYFNPDSSPQRTAQAIKKLRNWFELSKIPMDVEVSQSQFKLVATAPYAFRLSRKRKPDLTQFGYESRIVKLRTRWPHQSFSNSQAADELGTSSSTARIFLKKVLSEKRIYTSGTGRGIVYRFQK